MDLLLLLAAKSLLLAGCVLVALRVAHRRSAAERSWIAHVGLAAIAALPLALLLPRIEVPAPAFLEEAPVAIVAPPATSIETKEVALPAGSFPAPSEAVATAGAGVDWAFWLYAAPAALLLLLTLTALLRLVVLKANANVLVEPRWLSALAHAQRRMGFKHGTALLTSDELRSPISWGLMRPVILLNAEAASADSQAEAVIAHELAHVAHLDWLKLLLARVTVALFWFNPLVWLLAREAHQLREEAADDSVLASDVEDTDYAKLLVGIARHECRGLLIGAHGVAPARGSLARRVARVLDSSSVRGPVARSFSLGVFVGAAALAAPLAAVTLTSGDEPAEPRVASAHNLRPYYTGSDDRPPPAAASAIGAAVSSAVASAVTTAIPSLSEEIERDIAKEMAKGGGGDFFSRSPSGATIARSNGETMLRAPSGATIVISAPGPGGLQRVTMRAPNGAVATHADARQVPGLDGMLAGPRHRQREGQADAIEQAIEMRAVGVTEQYIAEMRAASPTLRNAPTHAFIGLKAVGVTPRYVRELAGAGFGNASSDDLKSAGAVGVTAAYIRAMTAVGYRVSLDDFVDMRAAGVTPEYAEQFRRRGIEIRDAEQLIELRVHDVGPEDIRDPGS